MPDRAEVMPQLEGPRISATRREPWFAAAGLRAAVISAAPAGLLIALVVVAYLPAFGAKFAFDDRQEVVENSLLTSWWGLWQIWTSPYANIQYYPLTYTTFWVEWHLWGLKPAAYHVTNILLHGLNAVLFWRLLRRLGVPGALLAAAVFAVHPVHVE